ncbi:molybdopterin-dependent oxidoreductase [Solirubrobacter sp. CPCC 204708]|uniref:Molybdopterin-dependent oxidoreductase n=1 Tax=Solirubrobacter deserti TaxID=2282478 RepID=A0ABT4RH98_9ACTN|nr:molybdopterin-dependent oxidoreductase [Solirubrobacter deserti]MBE2315242.1 molybdopterin-dependent oxidoreductase [Solirubrobacter deserti]MDA0137926.1 molybdopterin-dependent oxidoreductase [Solirubrobacter deserti]
MRPPGPFREGFFRSPIRGPVLTGILGSILLVLTAIVALTGFLSHIAYMPDLPGNAIVPKDRDFPLTFDWPTSPSWLYALTQGLHTNVGLVVIPFVLAKLWSVFPRLFVWPPAKSPAQAIERLSIALLVSSTIFQLATGVANAQYWYPFKFNFVVAHYYGAIVFVAALAIHVIVKMPMVLRVYKDREWIKPIRQDLDEPTISRRGVIAFAGAGALTLLLGNVGQSIGGPLRKTALFAPRRDSGFPVNKTARQAGITPAMVGDDYQLVLRAGQRVTSLTREDLLALPQHTARLPIACVEGWSTTQEWTGVRLSDLRRRAGASEDATVLVQSLQEAGVLRRASLSADQLGADDAMLALKVNGEDLSLDHGYPARIIVPALPGVHNTKWVAQMDFNREART